ncbi:MAG TPA: bifunctional 2-polyprenyl-6-hydroxyphenol methylase/3-demethylubiquinol 3-O-methyltransferase UbiG [Syntrophales bacterium]|nr:bifunctional 2-polyprenyl-6-hydroxyphenol methylase/3-demethylubiquinol 3-O-methyltransferase UbiG [Syntrophales bacterium]
MQVNNEIYSRRGHAWWDEDEGEFATIRYFVNPVRFGYFRRILEGEHGGGPRFRTVLDVGCGGGLLAEEFARAGFEVTGVDSSEPSILTARRHAMEGGLRIEYGTAAGEQLPFSSGRFDVVLCCDVLEHVGDVGRVISEISRVLRTGGIFCYDTINRTFRSWIAVIKVMQDWPSTAFAEPNSHVWKKFIRPAELSGLLAQHGLVQRDIRGIAPRSNPVGILLNFNRRVRGRISYRELGRRLDMRESSDMSASYMGYAVKGIQGGRKQAVS